MAADKRDAVTQAMRQINETWREGRLEDLAPRLHPDIVMVFPGFTGRIAGRDQFLAGFKEFTEGTAIEEFTEDEYEVDVVGDSAVVTYMYSMIYERSGERYRATGRDVWVFQYAGGEWLAVWRTMLDLAEESV